MTKRSHCNVGLGERWSEITILDEYLGGKWRRPAQAAFVYRYCIIGTEMRGVMGKPHAALILMGWPVCKLLVHSNHFNRLETDIG